MAENPDAPITRITSLEINADPNSPSSVFAPAVLTTAEINAIPLDDLRAGGIVYNISVGSLQTYTINGWENIAVSGGGTDVFDNITVNNTATIATANVSGTTTTGTLTATTGNIGTLTSTGTITANEVISPEFLVTGGNVNLSSLGVNSTDIIAAGTIYGARPGGAFHFFNNSTTFVFSGTQTKLNLTTTTDYLNQFVSLSPSRLTCSVPGGITALMIFNFSGIYSATGALEFSIFKNASIPLTPSTTVNTTATQYINASVSVVTAMAQNDYLEVFISGTPGTLSFMNYNMSITAI